jgi:hypothetical protein
MNRDYARWHFAGGRFSLYPTFFAELWSWALELNHD